MYALKGMARDSSFFVAMRQNRWREKTHCLPREKDSYKDGCQNTPF